MSGDGHRTIAVDARYLSAPFGSLTVYCGNLLRALAGLPDVRPVALVSGPLDPSANELRAELADRVRWVAPSSSGPGSGTRWELWWVHRALPSLARQAGAEQLLITYANTPIRARGLHRTAIVHDLCGLGEGFPRTKKAFWLHLMRLTAASRFADEIWPISEATRRELLARFPRAERRIGPTVYNGVETVAADAAQVERTLEGYGLERGAYVVAFATDQARKNFGTTLAALAQLDGRRGQAPRLVGIAPPGEVAAMRERCRDAGLRDPLLVSAVEEPIRDALYAGALALLWPSTCEGFGYPVAEAMAQGCPPLVWRTGPAAEIVGRAIEPLPDLDPSRLAERIEALGRLDPAERDQLADRLRRQAGRFSLAAHREALAAALSHDRGGRITRAPVR